MMEVWRRKKRSFELEKGKSGGTREFRWGGVQGREINHVMFETISLQRPCLKLSIKYRQDTHSLNTRDHDCSQEKTKNRRPPLRLR